LEKFNRVYIHSLVCKEHSIHHVFPCPWPDCRNGVEGDQFELVDTLPRDKSEIYTRQKWISPTGEVYYSWNKEDHPEWFSVDKTIWNELHRLKILKNDIPDAIYHYTSLEGFKGIIDSDTIWLSDYSYLNDSNELAYGVKLIKDIASDMLGQSEFESSREILQAWIDNIEQVKHRVCIASFSGNGDSLSQWRSYGNIAIGFNPLFSIGAPHETHIMPIEYSESVQKRWAKLYLSHLCQAYSVDISLDRLKRIGKVYHNTDKLIKLISFFKDPGFREEDEYRIAYIEDPELFEKIGEEPAPKNFRISNGNLIPYVRSSDLPNAFDDKKHLSIKKIVLGPNSDLLLERSIREYLDHKGYGDIEILRSKIPYRT
jgi:hypothetical protein